MQVSARHAPTKRKSAWPCNAGRNDLARDRDSSMSLNSPMDSSSGIRHVHEGIQGVTANGAHFRDERIRAENNKAAP